jgi:hypothetical protein
MQSTNLTYSSIVENFIVIICACMPAVASFAKHRLGGLTDLPSFGSRMLRSRTRKSDSDTKDSSESQTSVKKHNKTNESSYYELNDTVPPRDVREPAKVRILSKPAWLAAERESVV